MSVNPVTGVVTYTLAEWKEESQLWERDGALRERERIIELLEEDADANYYALRIIKGENNG